MATEGKIPTLGFKAAAIKFVTLLGFSPGEPDQVIGHVAIFDELTARALLHDERVWKATVRDELVFGAVVADE